jgi:lysylphosphatidylglycerol synthetase-like protein (DUF2156 family)
MALLFPLVLVVALVLMWRARKSSERTDARWFVWWATAGAFYTFSFLTGLGIGLLLFPIAAAVVLWMARRAPGREALGFVAGVGVVLLLVAIVNRDVSGWLVSGLVLTAGGSAAYALAGRRE